MEEREIADQSDDALAVARGGRDAEHRRDNPVNAVRAPVREHEGGIVASRREPLEVADGHRRGGDEQ